MNNKELYGLTDEEIEAVAEARWTEAFNYKTKEFYNCGTEGGCGTCLWNKDARFDFDVPCHEKFLEWVEFNFNEKMEIKDDE